METLFPASNAARFAWVATCQVHNLMSCLYASFMHKLSLLLKLINIGSIKNFRALTMVVVVLLVYLILKPALSGKSSTYRIRIH